MRHLAFLILLMLTACTDVVPEVSVFRRAQSSSIRFQNFSPAQNPTNSLSEVSVLPIETGEFSAFKWTLVSSLDSCSSQNYDVLSETSRGVPFRFTPSADGAYRVCVIGKSSVSGEWQAADLASSSVDFEVDTLAPQENSIKINNGALLTNAMLVTLNLSSRGASEFYLATDSACSGGGSWQSMKDSLTTTLATANSENTIFVKYRDRALNETACISSAITHDGVSPSVTLSTSVSEPFNASNFSVNIGFSEGVTGFSLEDISVTNGTASGLVGSGHDYSVTITPSGQGPVTVSIAAGVAQDSAGNGNSASANLTRTHDTAGPIFTGLGDDNAWTTSKTWNWGCNETCTYRFVIDSTPSTIPSGPYSSLATATQASGNGTYYLHVQAMDTAGNVSTTHVSAKLDNTAPAAVTGISDGIAQSDLSASPVISFTSGSDAHSGVLKHKLRVIRASDSAVMKDWHDFTSGSAVTGLNLATNTSYEVQLKTVDMVGLESAVVTSDGWIADVSPPTFSSLSLGATPSGASQTPTLSWVGSDGTGGAGIAGGYEVRIFRTSDNTPIGSWSPLTAGGSIVGLSLAYNTQYYFKVRAVDVAGNTGESAPSSNWLTPYCPPNYIRVPQLTGYAAQDFCVAKYEMKNVGGVATSAAAGLPWVDISRGDTAATAGGAWKVCKDLGAQYDLISNAQWQAIARNIEAVPSNWSGGAVGLGGFSRGHTDNSPSSALAADSNDDNGCVGTGESCTGTVWNLQRRTHRLNNGEV
ncbi:MAG: hypothetical protein KUL82_05595, partial [Bdellovibrio sp.]|nr:hypothetical protein [Bdellovibrio sp.]